MNLVAKNLSYKPDDQFHLNEVSFNFKKEILYNSWKNFIWKNNFTKNYSWSINTR